MKTILLLICTLILGISVSARTQQFEYGKPSELKGLTKLYIMPSAGDSVRQEFAQKIEKSKSGIKLVDDPKDAQMVIKFRPDVNQCFVAVKGKKPESPRILMEFKSPQDYKSDEKPDEKFIDEFLSQYKTANNKNARNMIQELPTMTTVPH